MTRWMALVGRLRGLAGRTVRSVRLELLRHRLWTSRGESTVSIDGLRLRVTDGPNAYMQYKDEFVRRNYSFASTRANPVVIDGGANMGMFSIATRREHPSARITAFEPDPAVFALLRENLHRNGAADVTLINAALGAARGETTFTPDGEAGGALDPRGADRVRVEPLSAYLDDEVDFLKLNIEGAELDVLREAATAGRLRNVGAMVIEYHGWPHAEQRLGLILSLLDAEGFRYLVHDFDEQTNPATKPPFTPPGDSPWFALVYAWRVDRQASGA